MKTIPQLPKEGVEPLYDMAHSAMKFHLLGTAIDLHVHDFFDTPQTAKSFSHSIDGDDELVEKFLNALVAMDLLVKQDSFYVNSAVASAYLVSAKPFFQGAMLKHMESSLESQWAQLGPRLKDGPLQPAAGSGSAFDKALVRAMAQWALSGGVHHAVQVMTSLPEFAGARTLLDVGGGHGLYTVAFCQANPLLEGVVLDLPPVVEVAEQFIAEYEMGDRIKTISGDYAEVDWGGEYDIIFAADVFFKAQDLMTPIVRKIGDALKDGGVFVSKHQRMDATRLSPAQTVMHDLMLFARRPFPPHTYSPEEFVELFRAQGFDVETFDMDIPCSPTTAMICRRQGER